MAKQQPFLQKLVQNVGVGLSSVLKQRKAIALDVRPIRGGLGDTIIGKPQDVGISRASKVTFQQLRLIAGSDTVIRICINIIKKAVSQAEWNIVPTKRHLDDFDPEHVDEATELFELVNTQGENLRSLLDMVLEDLLVLDAGVIEKVSNFDGELTELNSVDGATIRPVYNKFGELQGYVQIINNKVEATFAPNEIIYIMQNPQNDINHFGYGKSPIEEILLTVQASLNADIYNAQMFSKDNIPPGILDLGNMSEEEAQNFIAMWNATVVYNTQKMKFVYGSDNPKKFVPLNASNKDMQYMKYVDWLSRLKLATYGLSAMDANITQDVNRATAEIQQSITNSRGVSNIFALIEEYLNREVLIPMGFSDVQFKFNREPNIKSKKTQAEIDQIYINAGVVSPSDIAKREGFDTYEEEEDDEELDMGRSPNPEDNEIKKPESDEEDVLGEDTNKRKNTRYFKPLYK